MSRKVFVSFLGTSNYVFACYRLGEHTSQPCRFIQQALIEEICIAQQWTSEDAIYIFHTQQAFEKNWKDDGQKKLEEGDEIGLESILNGLKSKGLQANIHPIPIKEGFNNKEIWGIFDTVYNQLKEEDEIYFDVTHAFRSIPLFAVPLFNYAHFLKRTQLKAIYYGAFEKLGPAFEVRNMKREDRIADVIDLIDIVNLQTTNTAATSFIEFGKVGNIVQSNDNVQTGEALEAIKEQLKNLDFYIETCDMDSIRNGGFFKAIQATLRNKNLKIMPSEKLMLDKMMETFSEMGFKKYPSDWNVIAAIKWTIRHEMIQQAYTIAQEYLKMKVTFAITNELKKQGIEWKEVFPIGNKDTTHGDVYKYRDYAGKLLLKPTKPEVHTFSNLSDFIQESIETIRQQVQEQLADIRKNYEFIANNRNNLNHANGKGLKNYKLYNIDQLKQRLEENFEACLTNELLKPSN